MAEDSKKSRKIPVTEICTKPMHLKSKQGNFGTKITLQANYFKLTRHPDWTLNQYRVDIAPDETRTFVRKALLREHKNRLGSYLFDGTLLFTCHNLEQPLELNSIRDEDKQPINIKIRLVATVARGDYHYFQVFNIIMRKCLEHLNLALVGRNFYDPQQKATINQYKLDIWPGFVTSIRQHEAGIMMCAEISHKVMRTETLLNILEDCHQRYPHNYQNTFKQMVLGVVVITHYNNRTYKIGDVDFSSNPSSTFAKRDGNEISYANYYKGKYGKTIKDMKQPLLVSKSSAKDRRAGQSELVYLIPELCYSTGITESMRKDFQLMKALIEKTRINPAERIQKLMEFHKRLNSKNEVKADLNNWDLRLDNQLIRIPGRCFPTQKILFARSEVIDADNAEWDIYKKSKPMMVVRELKDWVVVVPEHIKRDMQAFIEVMISIARRMGFTIRPPKYITIPNDRPETYSHAIATINPLLVLCVVPNNQQLRYNAIKKKLCIEKPIPSQVILSRTLTHKNVHSIACKVAVQLNCKLGGTPWTVDIKSKIKGLMIVGFDVCHEKSADGKDFGAMVSSLDENFGQYFSAVTHQKSGEELSNCIGNNLGAAISRYRARHDSALPEYIIIYRDGVGEGQLPFVYDYEVKHIKEKLEKCYASNNKVLKFAFIVVTKRINTRLFTEKGANPKPGTVVDDVITDPLKYDFFIVSQNVRQGTVAPTSYNVIEDSTGFPPDHLQLITYKLCHMYFNFNGTVRVPAPCQYAHKLAFFTSQTLRQQAHPHLSNLLYFL